MAKIMIKSVSQDVIPQPNNAQHEWTPWDAFIFFKDSDNLAKGLDHRNAKNKSLYVTLMTDCVDLSYLIRTGMYVSMGVRIEIERLSIHEFTTGS